jgi:cell division septation protein DedD
VEDTSSQVRFKIPVLPSAQGKAKGAKSRPFPQTDRISPKVEKETVQADTIINESMDARLIRVPYSLWVGSFKTPARAERAMFPLRARGLMPYWTRVDLGEKGIWYRVFIGHFSTIDEANTFKEKHRIEADRILNTAYAVKIGEFSSHEALSAPFSDLREKGLSPYVIENPPGPYQLLVGAFVTKRAAEELALLLKPSIPGCKVILRSVPSLTQTAHNKSWKQGSQVTAIPGS